MDAQAEPQDFLNTPAGDRVFKKSDRLVFPLFSWLRPLLKREEVELRTDLNSANPMTTPQAAWPHSPATVALDWLFADLVSGDLTDALAADALLAPLA